MGHCGAKVMTARGVIEEIPLSKEETEQVRCRNVWPYPTFMGVPADGPRHQEANPSYSHGPMLKNVCIYFSNNPSKNGYCS